MNTKIETGNGATSSANLSAVLLYDNPTDGQYAKFALDRVMRRLPADGTCELDLWPFDLLEFPPLREEAAQHAARADVVVVSLKGNQPLPPSVRVWLCRWLGQKARRHQCLALLFDVSQRDSPQAIQTKLHLSLAANQFGVDLFLGFSEPPLAGGLGRNTRQQPAGHPNPVELLQVGLDPSLPLETYLRMIK